MELSEALRTIDATVGMFQDLHPLGEWDKDLLRTPVEVSFENFYDENFNPCTERKAHFYHKGMKKNINIIDIIPVCKFLVNEWPSPITRQLRKRLVRAYNLCYEAGKKSLYLFAPLLYDMKWWEKEHYSFTRENRENYDLYDALSDTLHEMFHAIKSTEEELEEEQDYTIAEEKKSHVDEVDWFRATNNFNLDAIKDIVEIGRSKPERRNIIKAIYTAMVDSGEKYKIPYSADNLLKNLYIENDGSREAFFEVSDESNEKINLDAFIKLYIKNYMDNNEASDADIDEIFSEDNKKWSETKNDTTQEYASNRNDSLSEDNDLPDCSDAPEKCFRFPNDFTKKFVRKVVSDYYFGTYANLALIEITLYDHHQLKKRASHTAFVKSLVYWGFIEVEDETTLNKIIRAVADKFKRLPADGYKEWPEGNKNDKTTCIKIGNSLDPSMKYQ